MSETKRCTKCGNCCPATTEYFPAKSSGKYGVAARCWPCFREDSREYTANWRERNPDKVAEYSRQYCESHAEVRRERTRAYREAHPDRVKESQARWYQNNREQKHEARRKLYAKNREREADKRRARYANNRERILKQAREHGRRWRMDHADNVREYGIRRRAAPGSFTTEDLAAIRAAQTDGQGRLICWHCGKPIEGTPHLDHWIPLVEGGTHDPGNLRYMHPACNMSKGGKHPFALGRLL